MISAASSSDAVTPSRNWTTAFTCLAHLGVGHADHCDVEDLRVQSEGVLYLLGIDVYPTGDDHEGLAVRQKEIIVLVEVSDVTDGGPVVVRGMP